MKTTLCKQTNNTGSPKLRQQCGTFECIIGRNFGLAATLANIIELLLKAGAEYKE
jgi:hypothetical protein